MNISGSHNLATNIILSIAFSKFGTQNDHKQKAVI